MALSSIPVRSLPGAIASLNALAAVFLIAGFFFIRAKRIKQQRFCMIAALTCSSLFLCLYLYFHSVAGVIRFGGRGLIRPVYFTLLISHTVLATVIVPLVLITLFRALSKRFDRHRVIARWTLPIWMYVSVTGVAVYWLLYVAYTPIWPT